MGVFWFSSPSHSGRTAGAGGEPSGTGASYERCSYLVQLLSELPSMVYACMRASDSALMVIGRDERLQVMIFRVEKVEKDLVCVYKVGDAPPSVACISKVMSDRREEARACRYL